MVYPICFVSHGHRWKYNYWNAKVPLREFSVSMNAISERVLKDACRWFVTNTNSWYGAKLFSCMTIKTTYEGKQIILEQNLTLLAFLFIFFFHFLFYRITPLIFCFFPLILFFDLTVCLYLSHTNSPGHKRVQVMVWVLTWPFVCWFQTILYQLSLPTSLFFLVFLAHLDRPIDLVDVFYINASIIFPFCPIYLL